VIQLKKAFFTLIVFFLCLPVAVVVIAGATDADQPTSSVFGTLMSFGVSMAASWLTGTIQKRTMKAQGWRNAIPATNATAAGGVVAALTQEPIYMASAAVGSLAASGIFSLFKRARTGRW